MSEAEIPEVMPTPKGKFKPGDPRIWRKGRTRTGTDLSALVRRIGEEPISQTDKRKKIEGLVRIAFQTAAGGDMRALEVIMERGWGKAVQPIENSGGGPLVTIIQEAPRQ